jgi:hypothetical protein
MDHYKSWLQLVSDVVDGTRSIASFTKSDGTGTPVTYAPSAILGYAGMVELADLVIPAPVVGDLTVISDADALAFIQTLEGAASDMIYETSAFNKLGIETFVSGRPLVFAETKTLNAIDSAWAAGGVYKGFPTVSAREYIRRFADIVEIDIFPALPTNETYALYHIGAVMMDRDAMREVIKYADVESSRCTNERATGYNYQGESVMYIWKGAPSYALLVKEASGP